MSDPDDPDDPAGPGAEFAAAVGVLLRRVSRWNQRGWSVRVRPGTLVDTGGTVGGTVPRTGAVTRIDVAHALVQRLADLAADAEGRPRRPVPRLGHEVLPDQLAVTAHDVVLTGSPETQRQALAALRACGLPGT